MPRSQLPQIQHELFLGPTGFLGLRCGCGFLVTGRSATALEANMNDHARAVHLGARLPREDEDTLKT